MAGPLFMVFGVSGVGKSTACRDFADRHREFLYVSASGLLSSALHLDAVSLRTQAAGEIQRNQSILAAALADHRRGSEHRPVLLDAHSVIDNGDELVIIGSEVVEALQPDGLIFLEAEPSVIHRRRSLSTRQRPSRSESELRYEQTLAKEAVGHYAAKLKVPIVTVDASEQFSLDCAVEQLKVAT